MAIAELVKIFRPSKGTKDETYTEEEIQKLQKMRKIKGDVKVLSPDYKQLPKNTEDTTTT